VKIKIGKDGRLWVDRAGNFKVQCCPHNNRQEHWADCGDWCPLFGEPGMECPDGLRGLEICGKLLRGEITDERGAK